MPSTRCARYLLRLAATFVVAIVPHAPLTAEAAQHGPGSACHAESALLEGQNQIDSGQYTAAVQTFTCAVDADPFSIGGYRGRIEARLMLRQFAAAFADYARVTAIVLPAHPDAAREILDGYEARLSANADDVHALTGASFARWWLFDYNGALPPLERLLTLRPDDIYGVVFRGSSRLFAGSDLPGGEADFARAIGLAPRSADVRWVVADGYTYALPRLDRAYTEAALALRWGLDTPRVHAILAAGLASVGDVQGSALHIQRHLALVTAQVAALPALQRGKVTLDMVPYRTFEIPLPVQAGERVRVQTTSPGFVVWDSILLLLDPAGAPVLGSDDFIDYWAGFDWIAPQSGVYRLRVASFEGVFTGRLVVTRK